MNTERLAPALLAGMLWAGVAPARSQPPAGAEPAGAKGTARPAPEAVLSPPIGTPPAGTGPGFHDPRSAFKPLQEREGVLSWRLLSSVTAKVEKNRIVPSFPADVRALNNTPVKVQGFMLPLEPGERQRHFLLSAVPTTCNFCIPAGPEGLIEVRTREPVRYSVEAITVSGRFAVLTDDKFGLFYRVADAVPAP